MILTIFVFIAILTGVVFIHEFGHFITAKIFGVYVEEFGIGFPPRVVGTWIQNMKRRYIWWNQNPQKEAFGRTIYSWNLLPIGGFVRLYGDGAGGEGTTVEPQNIHLTLSSKPAWQRLVIMAAGVIMNFLFAAIIFSLLLVKNQFVSSPLPMTDTPKFIFGTTVIKPMVVSVAPRSPAAQAGIQSQDKILGFVNTQTFIDTIQKTPGALTLRVHNINSDTVRTVRVLPLYDSVAKKKRIGVELINIVYLQYQKPHEKILVGFLHGYNLLDYNMRILGNMTRQAFASRNIQALGSAVSGPVGIGSAVGEVIHNSGEKIYENTLNIVALLSLSLGFMNLLPFPALDGGRIALLIPELLAGRKVPENIEKIINTAGIMLLLALSVVVTVKDIWQIIR